MKLIWITTCACSLSVFTPDAEAARCCRVARVKQPSQRCTCGTCCRCRVCCCGQATVTPTPYASPTVAPDVPAVVPVPVPVPATPAVNLTRTDRYTIEVSGSEADLLRFFDVYQTAIWPDWKQHKHTKQLKHEIEKAELGAKAGSILFNVRDKETLRGVAEAAKAFGTSVP